MPDELEQELCLAHLPPCVRVNGEWRRQIKTAVRQDDGTWLEVWRPVHPDDKAYTKQIDESFEGHPADA